MGVCSNFFCGNCISDTRSNPQAIRPRTWLPTVACIYLYVLVAQSGSSFKRSRPVYVLVGQSLSLTCGYESSLKEGSWEHEGEVLYINRAIITNKFGKNGVLMRNYSFCVSHVSFGHEGVYECLQNLSTVSKYLVVVTVPPKVSLSYGNVTLSNASYHNDHGYELNYGQNNTYVAENQTIDVTCLAEGAKPQADITWMINGEIVDDVPSPKTERNLHENRTFDSTSTLEFKPTGEQVTVTCYVILNGTDIGTNTNATFLTYVLPNVFLLHNGSKVLIDEVYVEKNETVNITCYAEGSRPPANLSWEGIYDHLATSTEERRNLNDETFDTLTTLIISPKKDVETIRCKSLIIEINDLITVGLTIRTYVLGKPFITFNGKSLDIIYINGNDSVTLFCSDGDSKPKPTLSWKINGIATKFGVTQSIGSSNLVFQPKHNDLVECLSYLNGPNITLVSNVSFHSENYIDKAASDIILTVVVPCAAAVILTVLVVICVYIAAKRLKGSQSTSISVDLDIPMEETSNVTSSKPLQKEYVMAGTDKSFPKPPDLELPKIPGGSEVPYYSELPEQENAYELNFHTEYYSAMGKSEKGGKMFSGKDICFILNMKMGHIYDRWMGTIDVNQMEKCVILSTVSEKLRKKEIHWHKFVKQALEIPEATNLTIFEGIGIYEGKLYLIQEHMDCEKLDVRISVPFSRPEVMEHLIGILAGLEFIQSYGLLHPGLSTRKILLTNKGICKLYDFCLSEDASNTVRIRKSRITCTLNELAPEALLRDKYSKASDVWSVAVVIWQILSFGVLPFPNEEQSPASETAVYKIPETWPTNYKVLRNEHLLKSWNQETSLRPTLSQLKSAFVKNFEALDTYGPSNTSTDDLASSYVHMRGIEKSVDES